MTKKGPSRRFQLRIPLVLWNAAEWYVSRMGGRDEGWTITRIFKERLVEIKRMKDAGEDPRGSR